jgi:signal transduction histidine kinase/DNA-binding NarL/FixJ family response regulator/HPt (histidine-containing phosphotransfer) domain-containing protein
MVWDRFMSISFPIRAKLIALAVTTSLLTLVCTVGALCFFDHQRLVVSLTDTYVTMADAFGHNCAEAVEYGSSPEAVHLLSALQKDRDVERSAVFNNQGECIGRYAREPHPALSLAEVREHAGRISPDGLLQIVRPIMSGDAEIGQFYLAVRLNRLDSLHVEQLVTIRWVLVGSLILSGLLAWYLQFFISQPVINLLNAARRVTESNDYSIRVVHNSEDELGSLSAGFNAMLAQIAARDAQLAENREHLEEEVRKRTQELERKTKEARAASKAKSQFLANMSHEIRTPMNAILGYTEQLRKKKANLDPEQQEFLDTVYGSGKHLLKLINDILDLSKIEAGRMEMKPEDCSPHQIINQVISIMHVPAFEKGLKLTYNWQGPIPSTIRTDPERVRQILINVIGNAIKFTELGTVAINARLDEINELLELEVIDTGVGIPRDQQERIFKPFTQADYSMTRKFGGTGLGLTISRRLAELLGGTLTVQSELGYGSSFKITLATGSLDEVNLTLTHPTVNAMPTSESEEEIPILNLNALRVLLVEDGETNRRLIHIILRNHDCQVTDAENGLIGLELALNQEFDVILLDMQMPVMDGYTAAKKLRQCGLTVPIIALTAHAMSGDEDHCLRSGCTSYLTKPVSENALICKIGEVARRQEFIDAVLDVAPAASAKSNKIVLESESIPTRFRPSSSRKCDRNTLPLPCHLSLEDPIFREIVEDFAERFEQRVKEARESLLNQKWDALADFAHWTKGSGGTVGFNQFTAPAGRLEEIARTTRIASAAASSIQELEVLGQRVYATINERVCVTA